jgi:hypothetical protein
MSSFSPTSVQNEARAGFLGFHARAESIENRQEPQVIVPRLGTLDEDDLGFLIRRITTTDSAVTERLDVVRRPFVRTLMIALRRLRCAVRTRFTALHLFSATAGRAENDGKSNGVDEGDGEDNFEQRVYAPLGHVESFDMDSRELCNRECIIHYKALSVN